MAGFVLVHGAWHGGWCFDPVADMLRARGHKVVAPDLPGMGADAESLRAVTLSGWAEFTVDICHALRRELDNAPLVLAGHSRGGLVVSAAAEADPSAMDSLAYICALMVPDGKSGNDMSGVIIGEETIPTKGRALGEIVADGAGWMINTSMAGPALAQLSPPELVAGQVERLVVEPTAPLATTMHVSEARWGSKPRWFIECEQDRIMPIDGQRRLQALFPGTRTITLDADHSPFYSAPEDLTDALLSAAGEPA
jgi:pimeloyl-ACP methyl ester carboxylesterase